MNFGQNINGRVRPSDLGRRGAVLSLTHGEALEPDGDVATAHLAAVDSMAGINHDVGQKDRIVFTGVPGNVFEPRHTTHGFQHVRVEGHPGELSADDLRAVVVHTDFRRTGWFRCSDVIVPWEICLAYGDERILANQYDCMVRWVDFAVTQAREGRFRERIVDILGKDADAKRYADYANKVLQAWRTEFIRTDGSWCARPETIWARDPSPPHLLPVLANSGHLDIAYDLLFHLFQDISPSWLTMINRGATTSWEEWEGIAEDGTPQASLNHYSKSAVISFLRRHVAGIHPREDSSAYHHFDIRPRPGGGITWAQAEFDSPHGRIISQWEISDDRFHL